MDSRISAVEAGAPQHHVQIVGTDIVPDALP